MVGSGRQPQRRQLRTSTSRRNNALWPILQCSLLCLLLAPWMYLLVRSRLPQVVREKGRVTSALESDFRSDKESRNYAELEHKSQEKPRLVVQKLLSMDQPEGDGASVRRSIGRPTLRQLDPFLLLDHFTVSPPAGFPDHPHRGFETVTYMLEGAFTHQDFDDHKGTIGPGDVQWMTAGRGIVHSEMPARRGAQRGLQLWVNLPSRYKMVKPKYQEVDHENIVKVEKDGVKVSIIAGESYGIRSPVHTLTPTMFLDFTLQPGALIHQSVPEGWNTFIYVLDGSLTVGTKDSAETVDAYYTATLSFGSSVTAWNRNNMICRFVLIGGEPLNEPVAQYGPFVMNTDKEIKQALQDYQFGQNGFEKARTWQSSPLILS